MFETLALDYISGSGGGDIFGGILSSFNLGPQDRGQLNAQVEREDLALIKTRIDSKLKLLNSSNKEAILAEISRDLRGVSSKNRSLAKSYRSSNSKFKHNKIADFADNLLIQSKSVIRNFRVRKYTSKGGTNKDTQTKDNTLTIILVVVFLFFSGIIKKIR